MNRAGEVLRILERYLVEVVERYALCPWARGSRERGELVAEVLWGDPTLDAWVSAAARQLARPGARVVMLVAPELTANRAELGMVRDRVAARLPAAGVAEFHPDAPLDLTTPARLVPFVRRSPDPLLQLVPLTALDAVRAPSPVAELAQQAAMLGGHAAPPRAPVAAQIAATNHATVAAAHGELAATLAAIDEDRRGSYARAGITSPR